MGTPLLIDSLIDNGMYGAIEQMIQQDASPEVAMQQMKVSVAVSRPVSFAVKESIKWGFYKNMKNGAVVEILGIKFTM